MPNLLVPTNEGYRILELVEAGHQRLADGQECWIYNDKLGRQVMTRIGHNVELINCVNASPQGLILEFGVAAGTSIRRLAESGRQIYGFDWWKGLPHAWNEADGKGSCYAPKPNDLPVNVELVDGLFSDTLPEFLGTHDGPVAFVHIDCDLYAPSLYVLHCLVDRFVKGSMIAFDEIDLGHYGELQAWWRYLEESRQDWEFLGKQHPFGEVYRMVDARRS